MTNSLINIIKKIEPLQRYNVSPDLDYSLKIIKSYYPELRIIKFKSGKKVWDWIIPKKWKVEKAYIEVFTRYLRITRLPRPTQQGNVYYYCNIVYYTFKKKYLSINKFI